MPIGAGHFKEPLTLYSGDGKVIGPINNIIFDSSNGSVTVNADSASSCPSYITESSSTGTITNGGTITDAWTSAPYSTNTYPTTTSTSWTTGYVDFGTSYFEKLAELEKKIAELEAQNKMLKKYIPTDKKTYRVTIARAEPPYNSCKPYRVVYVQAKDESSAVVTVQNTESGIDPEDVFTAEEW